MAPEDKICVIKEQGDNGLFADEISEEDQKKIEENFKNNENKED